MFYFVILHAWSLVLMVYLSISHHKALLLDIYRVEGTEKLLFVEQLESVSLVWLSIRAFDLVRSYDDRIVT